MKHLTKRPWLLGVLAVLAVACARPYPPPGGDVAEEPPYLIDTSPEPDAVVDGWTGDVVLRFSQRLSERGLRDAVLVSPASGQTRVSQGSRGRELRVRVSDGWRTGEIYRIELRPGLRDLFGNELEEPLELFFSTGPDLPETAIAGMVTDRLSGRAVERGRVEAVREPDSVTYLAYTDGEGFFALRHLPPGRYDLRVYLDQNRNARLDPTEPRDTASVELAAADTLLFAMRLLAPDSTPARLARAVPEDSVTLRLVFDDPIDPERPLSDARVSVVALADGTEVAVDTLLHLHEWQAKRAAEDEARRAEEAAEREREEAEAAEREREAAEAAEAAEPEREAAERQREEAEGVPDEEAEPRAPPREAALPDELLQVPEQPPAGRADGRDAAAEPLPAREFVVVLRRPLRAGARYGIEVSGLENIHRIPDGGGEYELEMPGSSDPPPGETEGDRP